MLVKITEIYNARNGKQEINILPEFLESNIGVNLLN
jgi:hypothetical protein